MRLADYVISYLETKGIKHLFMLSGGGIMYLVDAVGRSNIEYVCCHHEQAAGIAAVGYALQNNNLGVCMITTGPGGTNALTATGAAYVDSTPVIFLSGQVKTSDFASIRNVRQFGAQENDIVSMAKPVTKYAVTVTDKNDIKYHLEKAVFLALNGRRGPVWIDIPQDIQNSDIDPDDLRAFIVDDEEAFQEDIVLSRNPDIEFIKKQTDELLNDLSKCERPLILAGHGLKASGAEEKMLAIFRSLDIPIQTTWRELALLDDSDPLFYGSPGLQARRYSNLIIQNADLLVVLGSRLDNMITAFNEEHFAFRAKKYIVDIDINEIRKYKMPNMTGINCDLKVFIDILKSKLENASVGKRWSKWVSNCSSLRDRYPLLNEMQAAPMMGCDLYKVASAVSEECVNNDTIVISSTSRCNTAGHIAFKHKSGQRLISSMGFGSMGFALPQVVGAYFASDKGRVIMFEGDGSLQLNLQEFQTIVHHNIDAKMFIFSNTGYAAITTMQDRNFGGFHVGSDAGSGLTLPNLKKIANAYGIPYHIINEDRMIGETVHEVMNTKGPVICEFVGDIRFDEIPKCISSVDENGNRVSAALENAYPFLDSDVLEAITREIGGDRL